MSKLLSFIFVVLVFIPAQSQDRDVMIQKKNPFTQNYFIEITAIKGNNVTTPFELRQDNTFMYCVSIKWLDVQQDKVTVEIDRVSDVFVNDKSSGLTVANNIAVRTSEVLYPLVLSFDAKGNITEVANLTAIQERWEGVKAELHEDFYGEGLDRYLELAGRRIKAADALIYALNNDCFLSLFFNNVIYTSYTNDKANGELYFPFIQDTEALKNTISLKKELAENKNIYIGFQGEISDERSSVDLRNESSFPINRDYPKAKGEYFGAYFVDPAYNVITGISFYYKFDSGLELEVEKAMMVKTGRLSELEKPVNEIPKVKNSTGKIHIPLVIYKDMERDVQRHINPLVDIKRMTMRDYTGEGITMR